MATAKTKVESLVISEPKLETAEFRIEGTAPLVVHAFSQKAKEKMMADQAAGGTAKSKRTREPKDFDAVYLGAFHMGKRTGKPGFPASAFRNAMIDACRLVGFKMTHAKLSVFVQHDDIDQDGFPIVLIEGEPRQHSSYARNETGVVDIRVRPMWEEWAMVLRVTWDADQFTVTDVANLLLRAGMQVGVGEGRPNSKKSFGLGWGTFRIAEEKS